MKVSEILIELGYDEDDEIVIFENPSYDSAFIGMSHDDRAVYLYEAMVGWYVKTNKCSYDDAIEFIDYNTIRALPYVKNSPIVVYSFINFNEEVEDGEHEEAYPGDDGLAEEE